MPSIAPVARYIGGRLVTGLLTLLVVTVLVFGAIHLVPGSYAQVILGSTATAAQRARLSAQYGLNQPLPVQYWAWLQNVIQGNLGRSLSSGQAVTSLMAAWLPVTAELAILAVLFTILLGLPLALLAGSADGQVARILTRLGGACAISTPDFVIGSVLLYLFSRYSLGLTVGDYVPLSQSVVGNLRSMLVPAFTLGVFGVAVVVRTGRDSIKAIYNLPHVGAAVARGESRMHILRHHVMRNASIPVVTVLATYTGYLMGGAVIAEYIFSLPGMGQAVLNGVQDRNYPVVQGVVLVAATAFIGINILTDVLYGFIDRRVLTGQAL